MTPEHGQPGPAGGGAPPHGRAGGPETVAGAADTGWLAGPAWPGVRIVTTTRQGGASLPPYDGFNLAMHVGDDPEAVGRNRAVLAARLPGRPQWLEQVHGCTVADADARDGEAVPRADAAVTAARGRVLAILTADCLPVVLVAGEGEALAAAHAGWRGLAAGVLDQALAALARRSSAPARAWIGPAIGPRAFEVGDEVRAAFVARDPAAATAFVPAGARDAAGRPKWRGDLPALAAQALRRRGVREVVASGVCTVEDERFFSYRRDGVCGRFATLAWLQA